MSTSDADQTTAWQPIETAPLDGTPVLLWGGDSMNGNTETASPWVGYYYNHWILAHYEVFLGEPTHWMPLLEPPHEVGLLDVLAFEKGQQEERDRIVAWLERRANEIRRTNGAEVEATMAEDFAAAIKRGDMSADPSSNTTNRLDAEIAIVAEALPLFQIEQYFGGVLITANSVEYPNAMDEVLQTQDAAWRAIVELARAIRNVEQSAYD